MIRTGVRVWLAIGHTDMRDGFAGLSLQVQEALRRDPLLRVVTFMIQTSLLRTGTLRRALCERRCFDRVGGFDGHP
jgi:IS66 Orf2 like protein